MCVSAACARTQPRQSGQKETPHTREKDACGIEPPSCVVRVAAGAFAPAVAPAPVGKTTQAGSHLNL